MASKIQNLQMEITKLKYENSGFKETINRLTNEYNDYRNECDEICKEYEETIQLLSESLNKEELEKKKLINEKEKIKFDYEKSLKEVEKLREKNKEKIKDIEILNNKYEKLQAQINSSNKKETTLKSKLVNLEIDNDHYLNKIHQYEEEVADLKDKLEIYIENLTITQTDYEEYKTKKEDEIERLKQQLQEEKINVNVLIRKNTTEKNSKEKKEEKSDANGFERKLSWNEENNDNIPNGKKQSSKKIKKVLINEQDEIEHEKLLESGRSRTNRAMTIQKINCNYSEVIDNLRKRRERIAQFNQKIKKDSGKIK